MEVIVNGECHLLGDDTCVLGLLESLGADPAHVAVERNRAIILHTEFEQTPLAHGDVIEVVRFVAGG